jgi:hypothetical protein
MLRIEARLALDRAAAGGVVMNSVKQDKVGLLDALGIESVWVSDADRFSQRDAAARHSAPAAPASAPKRKAAGEAHGDGESGIDGEAGTGIDGEAGIAALNAISSKRPHLLWKIAGLSEAVVEQTVRTRRSPSGPLPPCPFRARL